MISTLFPAKVITVERLALWSQLLSITANISFLPFRCYNALTTRLPVHTGKAREARFGSQCESWVQRIVMLPFLAMQPLIDLGCLKLISAAAYFVLIAFEQRPLINLTPEYGTAPALFLLFFFAIKHISNCT
jgi:hypothetical protein